MQQWRDALVALAEQIVAWIEDRYAIRGVRVLHEMDLHPRPNEPLLTVEINERKRVHLEPSDAAVGQLPTDVDLFAYPTLRRVVLHGPINGGTWEIRSSEGLPMGYAWGADSLIQVIDILAGLDAAG